MQCMLLNSVYYCVIYYASVPLQYLTMWDELKSVVDDMGAHQHGKTTGGGASNSSSPNSSLVFSGEGAAKRHTPTPREHTASPFV